jgi:hypothetical protein
MSLTGGTAESEREEGESEQLRLEEKSANRWGPRVGGWVRARGRGRLAKGAGPGTGWATGEEMSRAMRKGNRLEEGKGWAAVQERGRKLGCWVGLPSLFPSSFSFLFFFKTTQFNLNSNEI